MNRLTSYHAVLFSNNLLTPISTENKQLIYKHRHPYVEKFIVTLFLLDPSVVAVWSLWSPTCKTQNIEEILDIHQIKQNSWKQESTEKLNPPTKNKEKDE